MGSENLLWAVKNGDLEACKIAAKEASFSVNAELLNGRNALHYAADYGHCNVVEYLISLEADVNCPDKHGITPLLAAVFEDHVECARLLIKAGAKKSGKAPDGKSYKDTAESEEMKSLF